MIHDQNSQIQDSQIQDGRQIQYGFPIFKSKYLSQFSTDLNQNLCASPLHRTTVSM